MRSLLLLFGLLLSSLALSHEAEAQPPATDNDTRAREEFRRGQQLYDAGQFQEAADAFDQAFRLSQRPQLLYNIFVSRRDAGQLGPAIDALRSYLDLVPNVPDAERLRQRLVSMERLYQQQTQTSQEAEEARRQAEEAERRAREAQEAAARQQNVAPTQPQNASAPQGSGQSTPTAPVERHASIVPWVVGGSGLALIAGGVVTGVLANGKRSDLEDLCGGDMSCPPDSGYEDLQSSGEALAITTDVLIGVGIGAVAAGTVLYFVLQDHGEEQPPAASASFGCTTDGCIGTATVAF